jgi:hypothetical protein
LYYLTAIFPSNVNLGIHPSKIKPATPEKNKFEG